MSKFVNSLNAFKTGVDTAVNAVLDLPGTFEHKKVGGLHHWKLGRIGGSFYVKKKRPTHSVKYKPVQVPETPVVEPTMSDLEVLKMQWRIKNIQDRKTSDTGVYDWSEK